MVKTRPTCCDIAAASSLRGVGMSAIRRQPDDADALTATLARGEVGGEGLGDERVSLGATPETATTAVIRHARSIGRTVRP